MVVPTYQWHKWRDEEAEKAKERNRVIAKRNHKVNIGEHAMKQLEAGEMITPCIGEDAVNSPSHYGLFPDMEVIDIIKKVLTEEEFIGYCKGNVLKYRMRAGEKDDLVQDINKANKYQEWLGDSY